MISEIEKELDNYFIKISKKYSTVNEKDIKTVEGKISKARRHGQADQIAAAK